MSRRQATHHCMWSRRLMASNVLGMIYCSHNQGCATNTPSLLPSASLWWSSWIFFFFQAEDGIRDYKVTGVQTCALPICERLGEREHIGHDAGLLVGEQRPGATEAALHFVEDHRDAARVAQLPHESEPFRKIGRASCRERV